MISFLIKLLCILIPVSAWRKAMRSKFVGPISRPKRMRRFNKIADWRFEDVNGVKVATGVLRGGKTIRLAHVFGKDITPLMARMKSSTTTNITSPRKAKRW